MTWYFVAIVGPILYAITNHIDKLLLERYFKQGGVGTLMLFSSLLAIIALPIISVGDWLAHGAVSAWTLGPLSIAALAAAGLLNTVLLWCYLQALQDEEPSIAIIFYQMVPVFGYGLGYFILGETLTQGQVGAMVVVILGTSVVAVEFDVGSQLKLRKRTSLYMLAAAFCWALSSVIFKAVSLEENVWAALFWEHVMLVLVGLGLFALVPNYRHHFLHALQMNSKAILSLNLANEALYMLGNGTVAFAYMMAPIALVLLAESFQPVFVLLIGVLLTICCPSIGTEQISGRFLAQKLVAVMLTGAGSFWLLRVAN